MSFNFNADEIFQMGVRLKQTDKISTKRLRKILRTLLNKNSFRILQGGNLNILSFLKN